MRKTLYLANPYGFSTQQRAGPLAALVAALTTVGAEVWEPFARNNQIDTMTAGWAYRVGQADLRDVREADGLFAVVNGERLPAGRGGDGRTRHGGCLEQADLPVSGRLPPLGASVIKCW